MLKIIKRLFENVWGLLIKNERVRLWMVRQLNTVGVGLLFQEHNIHEKKCKDQFSFGP